MNCYVMSYDLCVEIVMCLYCVLGLCLFGRRNQMGEGATCVNVCGG